VGHVWLEGIATGSNAAHYPAWSHPGQWRTGWRVTAARRRRTADYVSRATSSVGTDR